ncbi:MAG TPA: hypothetical protein VE988_07065, partial [Gemmataceae bacterium]|nr:hypothetical protein [Gemmataceae bacterium]
EATFPGLQNSSFRVSSPATRAYNCIGWAAGDAKHWWWPDVDPDNDTIYWPPGIAMEETLDAFVAAFATLGYVPCFGADFEPGFEKVALFAIGAVPTHAARQLPNGRWTSKLGFREDIEHDLQTVSGEAYGDVVLLLKRPLSLPSPASSAPG